VPNPDFALYWVHIGFWSTFGLTRVFLRLRERGATPVADVAPATDEAHTAPFSRALLAFHSVAFAVMYFGMGNAVIPNRVPNLFPGQRATGAFIVAIGAALMASALVYFQSWRFRAKLDASHRLATGGPFRLMRHPIYTGLNLLALGSALWIPTPVMWVAFALMVIGSDLRARAEEPLLEEAFGEEYRSYCARTSRFIPGIY
jgi:protein-S-isoprenylcysteine O-methyltransferase Ste14